jgi:hypothetical protein
MEFTRKNASEIWSVEFRDGGDEFAVYYFHYRSRGKANRHARWHQKQGADKLVEALQQLSIIECTPAPESSDDEPSTALTTPAKKEDSPIKLKLTLNFGKRGRAESQSDEEVESDVPAAKRIKPKDEVMVDLVKDAENEADAESDGDEGSSADGESAADGENDVYEESDADEE